MLLTVSSAIPGWDGMGWDWIGIAYIYDTHIILGPSSAMRMNDNDNDTLTLSL